MERTQQLVVQGRVQANLGRDVPVKICCDILAVHALWCGGQSQKYLWLEPLHNLAI